MQLLSSSVGIEDKKMVRNLIFNIKTKISKVYFNIPDSCDCASVTEISKVLKFQHDS